LHASSQGNHAAAGAACGNCGCAQQGECMHASSQGTQTLPGRPAAIMRLYSRAPVCMQARRVPRLLPEWLVVTVVPHNRACACMRASQGTLSASGAGTATAVA